MKNILLSLLAISLPLFLIGQGNAPISSNIKIDQFGYRPSAKKIAVLVDPQLGINSAESYTPGSTLQLRDANDNSLVFSGNRTVWNAGATHATSGDKAWHFDFSSVNSCGDFYIYDPTNNLRSYEFTIDPTIYEDVLKAAVRTFYYQRSNFAKVAPYAETGWTDGASHNGPEQDLDCRLVSNPTVGSSRDLSGGWYDAGDYNKYINFAAIPVHDLLFAFQHNPTVWKDDYNIPESGNGIPDLLDEVKYELDWFLKMQESDGSVLHKVSVTDFSAASPPSADTAPRRYAPATSSATRTACGVFAHAAIVFKEVGMDAYAAILEQAAIDAWTWLENNPGYSSYDNAGFSNAAAALSPYDQQVHLACSAIFLFELTGDTDYRDFFDTEWPAFHLFQWGYVYVFESYYQDAALYYTTLDNASAGIVSQIQNSYSGSITGNGDNFPANQNVDDPYLAFMTDNNYTWGNNGNKGHKGSLYTNMLQYSLSTNPDFYSTAEDYVHYFHGVNPFSFTFLSNMGSLGAENSISTFYHSWFSDGSPDWDEVGVSTYGPAPGFLSGGANPGYNPDAFYSGPDIEPPMNQPIMKSYKNWNTSWPQNSWEVTENAIYYQTAYIKLLSNFIARGEDNDFELDIQAFLEGAWDDPNSNMTTDLYSLDFLPGFPNNAPYQPYNKAPWNYAGLEGQTDKSLWPTDITDWVLVSLRTNTSPNSTVFRTAGLIRQDGSIYFPNKAHALKASDGPFYIVVEHRNHLAAMSPNPIAVSAGTISFDFRSNQSYTALGYGFGQTELNPSVYGLLAGDIAQENDSPSYDINGLDILKWSQVNGAVFYAEEDANLDGSVDGDDKVLISTNNGYYSQVPR